MDHQRLVEAMASLARAASGDLSTEQLLARLVDVAAEHLPSDGVGVMANDGGLLRFVHSTHAGTVASFEELQELTQEGPCHDALLFQTDVVVDDLHDPVQTAWPTYVRRALEEGFGSVVAVPLVGRGRVWGTLDLYRRATGTWQEEELQWVRVLAHIAVSYVVMASDRDHARRAQAELRHRSTHDDLTGLPNRALLFDRLEHALHTARRHHSTVAVFFIDLDRFKRVNDTFGHAAGDTVLAAVAARMSAAVREQDTLARLAGDEFVLVCEDLPRPGPEQHRHPWNGSTRQAAPVDGPGVAGPAPGDGHGVDDDGGRAQRPGSRAEGVAVAERVDAVTTRLHRALADPIRIGGVDMVVTASIGVAITVEDQGADDLLADADAAMYRAKQTRDTSRTAVLSVNVQDSGRSAQVSTLPPSPRQMERQLTRALAQGQLRVHFQPITDPTGAVRAVEALLRWQHPRYGLLPAARFIDLATGSGLIVGIGHWVIEQSCRQMARWQRVLGPSGPQTVYVNLTARELADSSLTTTLAAAVGTHGLQPGHLGLELVESSFIDPRVLPTLHEHHRRGHPLSVDDFGTGYSSLSRLVELPVTMAKIDKSFVAGIDDDPRRLALVSAVVTVADSLRLHVIAEGVESGTQARVLADAGCHLMQGFHYGRPEEGDVLTASWRASRPPA